MKSMNKQKFYPVLLVLVASVLFGASTPLTKMLLGEIQPVPLAAFLYLGSGFGLSAFQIVNHILYTKTKKNFIKEAPLKKKDYHWLLGATITGGILAPIILLSSLQSTPSSTASLLLNFESVATTLIAIAVFKENAGKQLIGAIILITLASILLSWNTNNQWGISLGSVGILIACFCWGIDNNFTRNISSKNPFTVVSIKGLAAGAFSFALSLLMNIKLPDFKIIAAAMVIGFFCYGVSVLLFVIAMRHLGSARTCALFGTAPFIGAVLSLILLNDMPGIMFIIAIPFMILGTVLLIKENHQHTHKHESGEHEHTHSHNDGHHSHEHLNEKAASGFHSHLHTHTAMEHSHQHAPDIDHRHGHNKAH